MRVGTNPAKENSKIKLHSYHRIIVPVYIPNLEEDFFKESFEILKLNIESILLTIHRKTRVSIYNNGSCQVVSDYLKEKFETQDEVDQFVNSKVNIGKINAIYAIVKSSIEPLFTITDADVFFTKNWQQEVEKVFEHFPKAGIVSPVPFSTLYASSFGDANFWEAVVRSKLKAVKVPNPDGLRHFERSIDRKMFKEAHYNQFITLDNNDLHAVLGSGHFVCTIRSQVFEKGPNRPTSLKLGGKVMADYIDKPNNDAGYLRLATLQNYAYHMGNKMEPWLEEEIKKLKANPVASDAINENINFNEKPYPWASKMIGKYIRKLIAKNMIAKRLFLKYVGLENTDY